MCLSYAPSNLSTFILSQPFQSRNRFIPGVITANGCTIFVHFYLRHICMNLPITECMHNLEMMCHLQVFFTRQTPVAHPLCVRLSLEHTRIIAFPLQLSDSFSLVNLTHAYKTMCTRKHAVLTATWWQLLVYVKLTPKTEYQRPLPFKYSPPPFLQNSSKAWVGNNFIQMCLNITFSFDRL